MRRLALAIGAIGLALVAASAADAATLCVGGPGCFSTIQAALNAAHDGDTITVAPGTYAGGVTIDVSVSLVGAGSSRTIIKGGGPVLTIGQELAPSEPTVSIRGVTITGGFNNSSPDSSVEFAGGIAIPWAAGFTTGATVTIDDSAISQNRVTPQTLVPPGDFCGALPCAFALGGAIFNAGTLTVTATRISDNVAGSTTVEPSVASGAFAGGIENASQGTLTLRRSFVTGNRAVVTAPDGQNAGGGGINSGGAATIEDSVVSGNVVDASTSAGGNAFAGGIDSDGSLVLSNSTVDHNRVGASFSSSSDGLVIGDAGGIEIDGVATITRSSIVANTVSVSAPAGIVAATGGGLLAASFGGVTIRDSRVAQNSVTGTTASGSVFVQGGGITNFGLMTLDRTLVVGNSGSATAASGAVEGGGIWNSNFVGGPPTVPQLTLTDSVVTANSLIAGTGIRPRGGGLFTTFPVALTRTVIQGNRPDQCFGC